MPNQQNSTGSVPSIQDLYSSLSEEQLNEAEENLRLYIELGLRVYERIRNDPAEYQHFHVLTESVTGSTMKLERSILPEHDFHTT